MGLFKTDKLKLDDGVILSSSSASGLVLNHGFGHRSTVIGTLNSGHLQHSINTGHNQTQNWWQTGVGSGHLQHSINTGSAITDTMQKAINTGSAFSLFQDVGSGMLKTELQHSINTGVANSAAGGGGTYKVGIELITGDHNHNVNTWGGAPTPTGFQTITFDSAFSSVPTVVAMMASTGVPYDNYASNSPEGHGQGWDESTTPMIACQLSGVTTEKATFHFSASPPHTGYTLQWVARVD
jgi:hypothetical protein